MDAVVMNQISKLKDALGLTPVKSKYALTAGNALVNFDKFTDVKWWSHPMNNVFKLKYKFENPDNLVKATFSTVPGSTSHTIHLSNGLIDRANNLHYYLEWIESNKSLVVHKINYKTGAKVSTSNTITLANGGAFVDLKKVCLEGSKLLFFFNNYDTVNPVMYTTIYDIDTGVVTYKNGINGIVVYTAAQWFTDIANNRFVTYCNLGLVIINYDTGAIIYPAAPSNVVYTSFNWYFNKTTGKIYSAYFVFTGSTNAYQCALYNGTYTVAGGAVASFNRVVAQSMYQQNSYDHLATFMMYADDSGSYISIGANHYASSNIGQKQFLGIYKVLDADIQVLNPGLASGVGNTGTGLPLGFSEIVTYNGERYLCALAPFYTGSSNTFRLPYVVINLDSPEVSTIAPFGTQTISQENVDSTAFRPPRALVADGAGNLYAGYTVSGNVKVFKSTNNGKTWSDISPAAGNLPTGISNANGINLAFIGTTLHIVYGAPATAESTRQFYHNTYNGSTWTNSNVINLTAGKAKGVCSMVSDGTNLHLTYSGIATAGTNQRIWYQRYSGGSWGAASELSVGAAVGTGNQCAPDIAESGGKILVVWSGYAASNTPRHIFYNYYNGTTWLAAAVDFNTGNNSDAYNDCKAVCTDGTNFYIVYTAYDSTNGYWIWFSSISVANGASGVTANVRIYNMANNMNGYPSFDICMGADGLIHLVLTNFEDTSYPSNTRKASYYYKITPAGQVNIIGYLDNFDRIGKHVLCLCRNAPAFAYPLRLHQQSKGNTASNSGRNEGLYFSGKTMANPTFSVVLDNAAKVQSGGFSGGNQLDGNYPMMQISTAAHKYSYPIYDPETQTYYMFVEELGAIVQLLSNLDIYNYLIDTTVECMLVALSGVYTAVVQVRKADGSYETPFNVNMTAGTVLHAKYGLRVLRLTGTISTAGLLGIATK